MDDVENSRHDTSIRLNSAQLNNAYSKCLEIIFLRARDIELSSLLGWYYEIFISQNSRGTCLDVEYILIRSRFFRNIALNFFLPFFLEIFANALSFEISDLLRFYYMLSFSNNFVERGRFMAE